VSGLHASTLLAVSLWFSPCTPVSFTKKTDSDDISDNIVSTLLVLQYMIDKFTVMIYHAGDVCLVCFVFVCWILTPLFQLHRGGQFHCWWKPECSEKTIDLSQVTDNLYHIMLY
jgi:hypothetical protein